jgi:CBS domain-containing protein
MFGEMFEAMELDAAPSLHSQLGSIVRRAPVTVNLGQSIRAGLQAMDGQRVGSVIVIDPDTERPRGIFTLQDLLRRVALKNVSLDDPIDGVMTRNLVTLRPQATVYEASTLMTRRNLRHVLVTGHDGRLVGLVSLTDLYALQRASMKAIGDDIRSASDTAHLVQSAAAIRRLALRLMEQGVSAEWLTHFISSLNDLLTLRAIELTARDHDLPDVPWCWIALGSEGRLEQTLSTDQDNGIVFEVAEAGQADALRARFLPFAQAVNKTLDACGFPLCRGNIMAGNPQWCLSLEEWRERFSNWIRTPQPQALLNATIFFDFRPLYGEESLAERLRAWLVDAAAGAQLFLHMMAENALQCAPPLGFIRDFVFDDCKEFPHTLDLKMYGLRPFVDAARIYALAHRVPHTGTAQRLRGAAEPMHFDRDEMHAVIDAFYVIQRLRLMRQQQLDEAGQTEGANRIDPDRLGALDRHALKEAFRQARKLQQRLRMDYQL